MFKFIFQLVFLFTISLVQTPNDKLFVTHINNELLHIDGMDNLELKGPIKKIVENRFDIFFKKSGGF